MPMSIYFAPLGDRKGKIRNLWIGWDLFPVTPSKEVIIFSPSITPCFIYRIMSHRVSLNVGAKKRTPQKMPVWHTEYSKLNTEKSQKQILAISCPVPFIILPKNAYGLSLRFPHLLKEIPPKRNSTVMSLAIV